MTRIINAGNRMLNTYLLELEDGWMLVDTGYPEGYGALVSRIEKHGIAPGDIRWIFLTHAHDDHAGFLNELLGRCDAHVLLHERATEGLRRGQNDFVGGCTSCLALAACHVMALLGKGGHRFPSIAREYESRFVFCREGDPLPAGVPGSVIETPGHTRCSISLLLDDGALLCGDAAMNGFPSRHRITIWAEDMNAFASSWKKIIKLSPRLICPGHGRPFSAGDLAKYLPELSRKRLYSLHSG